MLHRAVLGSLERFIGVLIEHYAGKFPLWLAPLQVVVAPITNEADDYAKHVHEALKRLMSALRLTCGMKRSAIKCVSILCKKCLSFVWLENLKQMRKQSLSEDLVAQIKKTCLYLLFRYVLTEVAPPIKI